MIIRKTLAILLATACICACMLPCYHCAQEIAAIAKNTFTLVIDAGHGGRDSGAVADDGTKEKDINLSLALQLKREAERYGINVILTRSQDEGLFYGDDVSGRWSKVGDMRERKRIIEQSSPDLTLSLHLNSFKQDASVRGAQVFYPLSGSEEVREKNKVLAAKIQNYINNNMSYGKKRSEMTKNDIYLFRNNNAQIILIECGFLSNADDLSRLKTAEFRRELCKSIMKAVADNYSLKLRTDNANNVVYSKSES